MLHKLVDGIVVDQCVGSDARFQYKTFKRSATAEGDIYLSMSEGLPRINNDLVEGKALALVDGDGPCQTQRYLGEAANFVFLNLLILSVDSVLHILPFQPWNSDVLPFTFDSEGAFILVVVH